MKISESWLREWVNPGLTREELCNTLTMAGLEVEDLKPAAEAFTGIVIGEVLKVDKHPEADRLSVCEVTVGGSDRLKIVCGARNVKAGMKTPVAMINAVLPNKMTIISATIRGVASEGMLCSASELGLAEESEGLLELPQNAPLGQDLRHYLKLEDYTIDIAITPNRGDCLSVRGIAREVSALTKAPLKEISILEVESSIQVSRPIKVESKIGCPHYVGRVICNVKADLATPTWLKERLRRSGVRSINSVVDVTNYVMLELGQPMHAFDLNAIKQEIKVRQSKKGEKIALLDGSEKELNNETLVIADQEKPLAIAGVMGGLNSSVTLLTTDIFLESAYFSPQIIAKQRQYYGLNSDSAYRFERGVDPTIQCQAIERATQLILDIVGGEAGPVIAVSSKEHLPKERIIVLTPEKITQVLGILIPDKEVEAIFNSLRLSWKQEKNGWKVRVPAYRFDLSLAEDLIEEITRLYGYDKIPTHNISAELLINKAAETAQDLHILQQAFSDQGYHEIVSYSFIDKKLQGLLDPQETPRELLNPITADMIVMRTNLWPGLITTLLYNKSRQQHRVRLFEIGTCFITRGNELLQQQRVGGLITGQALPEQWGVPSREADFYDLKGNIENILDLFYPENEFIFKPDNHPALHPEQTGSIYYQDKKLGILGALHPIVLQSFDLFSNVYVFELDLAILQETHVHRFYEISKFPEIRRDIALLVKQAIPAKDIQDTIKLIAGDWLKDVFIFDVYQGKGISPDLKSIALTLILQHPARTLVDDEAAELIERVIAVLREQLGAELRS